MDRSLHTEPISDDLLSELPADVLVSILEKLSLRDCVRAGVLSRRWRWPAARGFDMEHAMEVWTAHGRRFRALFDGCPAAFAAVTRLTLWNIVLDPANLGDILATCTRMETLSLHNCDAGTLQRWRAVRHARLTHLTVHYSGFGGIDLAWAPRLEWVAYHDWLSTRCPPLSFGHVPRLGTIVMSNRCNINEPTVGLSQTIASTAVTDLRLNFCGESIWVKPEAPKRFINIFDISCTYLKELYIKLWDHKCKSKESDLKFLDKRSIVPWEVPAGFKHYGLAQLTIRSLYIAGDTTVAYKRRMVEVAVNLKEIYLCERAPCKRCGLTAGTGLPRITNEKRSPTVDRGYKYGML
ncbi:hypothetical protein ACP4OV_018312 [Aristida adscensionis]